ncbi:threonine ammonia-lyase [Oceanobacillus halotolerans]|uniref:threonine ammonia-lyase n=1 Tax=Oceanobacillus halotolerans TaxID=2663380 RepID=UPI0013DCFD63|nr:threonine/serine dehydratase [Oceanobacillus halotolerans]
MVKLADIQQARDTIYDVVKETPILHSSQLSALCDNNLFLKGEHVQTTGSFKIRGATNKVQQVVEDGASSVTAASSGNHGQAVAYIANQLGVPATIVVPEDATTSKLNAIRTYQAKIETCGTTSAERIPRAKELAHKTNGVFIPPYDDPLIMAGQGTVGLEILGQLKDVDVVVVPVGGGGLISGILTAIKETDPRIKVIGVEPELGNDTYLSLQKNKITSITSSTTIADGLRTTQPGSLTFPVVQRYLDELVLVKENEIKNAMYMVMERMKQVIEPSSAVTVAAAMNGKLGITGKNVCCVASGGNIDLVKLGSLFTE